MEENQCAEGSGLVCDYNWLGSYLEGGKDIGDIPRAKLPLGSVQRTRREGRERGKNPCLLMRGKSTFLALGEDVLLLVGLRVVFALVPAAWSGLLSGFGKETREI